MSQFSITGGAVEFSQSRKIAEYENRGAKITFNVGDGEDAVANVKGALTLAAETVFEALYKLKTRTTFEDKVVSGEVAAAPAPTPKKAAAKKPAVVTAPPIDPTDLSVAVDPPAERQISNGTEDRKDPSDFTDLFTGEAPDVTDKMLQEAANRKATEFPAAAAGIRKLIGKYAGAGKQMSQIDGKARQAFLDEMKELKA